MTVIPDPRVVTWKISKEAMDTVIDNSTWNVAMLTTGQEHLYVLLSAKAHYKLWTSKTLESTLAPIT